MAQLTEEEAAQLKALTEKSEAPEPENGGGTSRVLNVSVDLGDPEQIERAIGLGFLTRPEAEELEGEGEGEGGEGEGEEGPRRRGFFPEAAK